jgi:hypothetical protein
LLAGCGSSAVDSGGLTASDRNNAQAALDQLHGTNIPMQLLAMTATAGLVPHTCRVRLESKSPPTFKLFVFWVPYVGPQGYTWLDATITKDASKDKFHLGNAKAKFATDPQDGGSIPGALDVKQALAAHAGNIFTKPGASCRALMNGDLRLVPNPPA